MRPPFPSFWRHSRLVGWFVLAFGLGGTAARMWEPSWLDRLTQASSVQAPHAPASLSATATLPRSVHHSVGSPTPSKTLSNLTDQAVVARFNGQVFSATSNGLAHLEGIRSRLSGSMTKVVLVGLAALPSADQREQLRQHGLDLLSAVPDLAWIARLHPGAGLDASGLPSITFAQEMNQTLRLRPSLRRSGDVSTVPVYVHVVADRDGESILTQLKLRGMTGLSRQSSGPQAYLAGNVSRNDLEIFLSAVGQHEDVQFIEPGVQARLLNEDAMRTLQSGSFSGPTPFFAQGIVGSNQVIAICDTGLDIDSCYFRDKTDRWPSTNRLNEFAVDRTQRKVIAMDFLFPGDNPSNPQDWDNHGHGTAVAGCAAGSDLDAPFDTHIPNGMAPGAKLIIQDAGFVADDDCADLIGLGCPVTNFFPVLMQAYQQGATIHNNSWGDRENNVDQNTYSQPCRELDLATWLHPEFLVVCAAGNSAANDSVGSPSVAKNSLSVAATQSGSAQERIAFFSSRGWASDGRFKPDLAAPGQSIHTAAGDGDIQSRNCFPASLSGTSFSSPLIAGMAALVRDYFAQGFYPSGQASLLQSQPWVSAALVKAVLLQSAVPMVNAAAPPPSRDQGWGRVNLSSALRLTPSAKNLWIFDATNGFGSSDALPYVVYLRAKSSTQPMKVTLVWSDYPATPGADKHLMNDLDLRVRSRERLFKGNVLQGGLSIQGGEFDHLNNVEQVMMTPQSGEVFEVSVWTHGIVEGPQPFALVVTGDFESFEDNLDADRDAMSDGWELWNFGSLDKTGDGDVDGDGVSNAKEALANSDPNQADSKPVLNLLSSSATSLRLSAQLREGRRYTLEKALSLTSDANSQLKAAGEVWTPVLTPLVIAQPIGEITQEFEVGVPAPQPGVSGVQATFYRLRIEGAPVLSKSSSPRF